MTTPLRILLLEDSIQDAELIQGILESDHFVCEVTRVQTRAEFVAALEGGGLCRIRQRVRRRIGRPDAPGTAG